MKLLLRCSGPANKKPPLYYTDDIAFRARRDCSMSRTYREISSSGSRRLKDTLFAARVSTYSMLISWKSPGNLPTAGGRRGRIFDGGGIDVRNGGTKRIVEATTKSLVYVRSRFIFSTRYPLHVSRSWKARFCVGSAHIGANSSGYRCFEDFVCLYLVSRNSISFLWN